MSNRDHAVDLLDRIIPHPEFPMLSLQRRREVIEEIVDALIDAAVEQTCTEVIRARKHVAGESLKP